MIYSEHKTYSKRLLHLISWSHWFTFFNIIAVITLSSFYVIKEAQPESVLGYIYLITTWTSHMSFLTFVSFVLILFPIILLVPRTRFIRTIASIIFTIELFLLLLDAFVYSRLGYHLNTSSSDQIIELVINLVEHSSKFWTFSIIAALLIFLFELVVSNYAWKHLRDLQKTVFSKFVITAFVISFFISHSIHIWADATLEYDILKQDTVLPLSYPSTAKALLTKYGLFDQADYTERRTSPLVFNGAIPKYPVITTQCEMDKNITQSVILVLTKTLLTNNQIQLFTDKISINTIKINRHVDNALPEKAWFNLFYSLPSIYKRELTKRNDNPLLFQILDNKKIPKTLTIINKDNELNTNNSWLESLFIEKQRISDPQTVNFAETLNKTKPSLHVIYFDESNTTQFEKFTNTLLLNQKQKSTQDIIWISSIGNISHETSLSDKPALLIMPNHESKTINQLTSLMDIQPTLIENWLDCDIDATTYGNGKNLLNVRHNRVIANTMDAGIVVFNKDKSVFVDQNGNFQSYSMQLDAPITVSPDFPLMIDGVRIIKQFSEQSHSEQ